MAPLSPDGERFVYDEFGYFAENCSEYGLDRRVDPVVARLEFTASASHPSLSALRWGSQTPRLVMLHGGAQNAHTWDTVLLALDVAALAIDLPGHGHSAHRHDGHYDPRTNADAVAAAIDARCDTPVLLVGMSLGGLTANALAARHPSLVERLVIVDVTPGVNADKAREIHDFIAGPQTFGGFEEILARTVEFNPTRSVESLRRGILHNAHRLADGSWEWNYDRRQLAGVDMPSMGELWDDLDAIATNAVPYLFVKAERSPVVDENDLAELTRRAPQTRIIRVEGSGHSVQGDEPVLLAGLIADELQQLH